MWKETVVVFYPNSWQLDGFCRVTGVQMKLGLLEVMLWINVSGFETHPTKAQSVSLNKMTEAQCDSRAPGALTIMPRALRTASCHLI